MKPLPSPEPGSWRLLCFYPTAGAGIVRRVRTLLMVCMACLPCWWRHCRVLVLRGLFPRELRGNYAKITRLFVDFYLSSWTSRPSYCAEYSAKPVARNLVFREERYSFRVSVLVGRAGPSVEQRARESLCVIFRQVFPLGITLRGGRRRWCCYRSTDAFRLNPYVQVPGR